MQVNAAKAYGLYKANMRKQAETDAAVPARADLAAKPGNTDQVSISFEGVRQREIEKVSSSILSEIEQPSDPEKLRSVQAAVQNNTYHVSTGDLVDAVMNRWFGL